MSTAAYESVLAQFDAAPDPKNGGPLIPAARHLDLAAALQGAGFKSYGYCVASHWPADAGGGERYQLAYALRSLGRGSVLAQWRVEIPVDAEIDSMVSLFAGADWQEREQFDLVGVRFAGHPDLRRIMLPDEWEGHPLRKDYAIDTRCAPWR